MGTCRGLPASAYFGKRNPTPSAVQPTSVEQPTSDSELARRTVGSDPSTEITPREGGVLTSTELARREGGLSTSTEMARRVEVTVDPRHELAEHLASIIEQNQADQIRVPPESFNSAHSDTRSQSFYMGAQVEGVDPQRVSRPSGGNTLDGQREPATRVGGT